MDNYYDFAREESIDGSVHYVFTTDFDLVYSVYFNPADFSDYLDDLPTLSKAGCLFGFFPIDEIDGKKQNDPRISTTVCKIVEDYFATYGTDKVLLFHCDSDDEKQHCRNKLFDSWFKRKPEDLDIYKDGLEVEIGLPDGSSKTEYLGFVIHGNETQTLEKIQSEFRDISVMLIDRKRQ